MNRTQRRGWFVVIEGPDGVGKSTAVQGLAERIVRESGREVVCLREPGGTPLGEAVRSYLKADGGQDGIVDLLLFSAARRKLVQDEILPALARGAVVLCDRFVLSTFAYQGGGLGVGDEDIEAISTLVLGGLKPDVTLLMTLDDEEWERRISSRMVGRDRYEERAFLHTVRERYLSLGAERDGVEIVQADGSPDVVVARLWDRVSAMISSRAQGTVRKAARC